MGIGAIELLKTVVNGTNFVVIGENSSHYDNFLCHQWRQSWHHNSHQLLSHAVPAKYPWNIWIKTAGISGPSQYQYDISAGIIWYMRPANERRRYNVTSSLIGWAHIQNDPWYLTNIETPPEHYRNTTQHKQRTYVSGWWTICNPRREHKYTTMYDDWQSPAVKGQL